MSVNDTGATGLTLSQLAQMLIAGDNDGKITSNELKLFVQEHQNEFLSISRGSEKTLEQMAAELKAELKNSFVGDEDNKEAQTRNEKLEECNRLKEKIEQYKKDIEGYTKKLNDLEALKKQKEAEITTKKAEFDKLEAEISKENENYKKIIDRINEATKEAEEDITYQQKRAVYAALAAYNPEKDGEWESFLEKRLGREDFSAAFRSAVKGLTSKADFISSNLAVLGSRFSNISSLLENLNNSYKGIVNDITATNSLIATTKVALSEAEVSLGKVEASLKEEEISPNGNEAAPLNNTEYTGTIPKGLYELVSEAEMQIVIDNNINLQEKTADGKPRYIFAKGKSDNAYHIYDMSGEHGVSLARKYGTCEEQQQEEENKRIDDAKQDSQDNIPPFINGRTNSTLKKFGRTKGLDIVPLGNGSILNFKESESGEKYYYVDECGNIKCGNADYCTCSPLSFDLNGDGVKTSSNVINFDIDGDGVVDKINDSADAVLVFDKDGDGISGEDGSETFGDNTDLDGDGVADGYKNGFEALKALAKQEGLINGEDDNELDENDLKILEEKYGLKIKTNGYNSDAKSLSDVGITNIKLSKDDETEMQDNFDGNGNQLMTQKGATFTVNGEEREYADIWHRKLNKSNEKEDDNFFISDELSSSLSFNINNTLNKIAESEVLADQAKRNIKTALRNVENFSNNKFMNLVNNKAKAVQEKAKKEAEKKLEEEKKEQERLEKEEQEKLEQKKLEKEEQEKENKK